MRKFHLFPRKKDENRPSGSHLENKGKDGKAHVGMFSDFFTSVNTDMFCTNSMYAGFKEQVISTVDVYSPKVEITLDVYETKLSTDFNREFLKLGFKKYIHACYERAWREYINELLQVTVFLLVGIAVIIIGYGLKKLFSPLEWPTYLITNLGTVLVWQFVGFWAFEYSGHKKELDRLKQVENIKYNFKKWD